MKYKELIINVPSEFTETACNIIDMLEYGGIYIEDYTDLMENEIVQQVGLVDDALFNKDTSISKIHIYTDYDVNLEECIDYISERFEVVKIKYTYLINNIDENDYTNCWKKYYKPLHIGKNMVIVPEWENYVPKENEKILKINPGIAFGTGAHETTSMCIEFLQEYVTNNSEVMDIGCGSGILSITALLCNAKSCFALDIDPNAVKVANENAKLNTFKGELYTYSGNILEPEEGLTAILKEKKFNIIVANIVADIIIKLSFIITNYLNDNGLFIVSGIINDRSDEVKKVLIQNNFAIVNMKEKKGWICIVAKRNIS